MPHPVIGPMEHPVAGLATRRKVATTPLVHGDTSLKPGDASPLLEAHPGSPVDFSRHRPSLATSLSSEGSSGNKADLRSPRSPRTEGKFEDVRGGGMAAKECTSVSEDREENNEMKMPHRRMQVTAVQPFYIPAKVPEEVQVQTTPISGDDRMSVEAAMEESLMDFNFETDNGVWISAHPVAHESRTSLATTTTASTLIDDRCSQALTIDTSVASSATSILSSSAASIQSAASSDIYGWEEELDRKASIDGYNPWEQETARRLSSGGMPIGPRVRGGFNDFKYKRGSEGRRRSLLHRVLNLSGRRGSEDSSLSTMSSSPSTNIHSTSA